MLPEGTVTVLFSDVEGSTDLRTREGDDVAQGVMRTHEKLLRDQLVKHGGVEVVFMGDGFMVAFASARKAIECAIAIQRCFDEHNAAGAEHPIRVRIGLNSGEVLRESGTLYGTAVNAAARISAKANGGQIFVSQITKDLTAGVRDLTFVDRGMYSLKGFPTEWRVHEVAWKDGGVVDEPAPAPAPARSAARLSGFEETFVRPAAAPLVGRTIERAALLQDLDTVAAGAIRVFAIAGEPGIGKTRLMEAAIEAAAERGFGAVMVGGDEELRGPFFMLRTLLGSSTVEALAEQAGAREALEQARGVLWGRRETEAGTGLSPSEQTLHIYDVATLAIRQIAETRPLLLLFDDLQWGDEDSLKLIRYLIRTSAQSPILIMLAHRPDPKTAPSPATLLVADLDRMRIVRQMKLERLNRAETAELLESLLGHPVSQECAATLHARGEGVPFFIVEFAQSFREAGMFQLIGNRMEVSAAARATVAPSVQILIERRLGQLPSATREALTDAAVIGRRFRLNDLARVRGDTSSTGRDPAAVVADELAPAVEANLLAPMPEGAAYDYGFTHDEIRGVLQTQGNKQRHRTIHAGLVKLMTAEEYPDSCLATIAFHALEAGDEEAGVRFSIEGARKSLETFAPEEALRSIDAARRAAASPEDRAQLLCLRDDALDALGRPDERLATLSEMAAFARALNDEGLELEATLRRASATRQSGDNVQAGEIALEAVAKAEARDDERALLRSYLELGQARIGSELGDGYSPPAGDGVDIGGAEEAYAKAWELAKKLDDLPIMAAVRREQGVVVIGQVRRFLQDMVDAHPDVLKDPTLDPHDIPEVVEGFERFRVYANEAVEMYEKLGDQRGVMSSLIAYAYANVIEDTTHGHAGRVEQIRRLRKNLSRMTSQSEIFQSDAYMLYSVHVYARGHGPADLELARGIETYEAARAIGMSNLEFLAAGGVALAYAGLGDIPEADTWLGTAGAAALSSTNALPERQLETWRGRVRAAAGDAAGMRRHLE
ncbi:MAG: BREX system ATP-binding domain-containing protein, partial [Actinomycetota bacterium]